MPNELNPESLPIHIDSLRRAARGMTRSHHDAEDLVQDIQVVFDVAFHLARKRFGRGARDPLGVAHRRHIDRPTNRQAQGQAAPRGGLAGPRRPGLRSGPSRRGRRQAPGRGAG